MFYRRDAFFATAHKFQDRAEPASHQCRLLGHELPSKDVHPWSVDHPIADMCLLSRRDREVPTGDERHRSKMAPYLLRAGARQL
jgi:hypothetical protein